ncbi:MAG: hypothetical protein M0C28_39245 [Candidatus Moduliflexus flocculans]|nr:hypothetical protein [Candidatus Moduliflexus flocculans]
MGNTHANEPEGMLSALVIHRARRRREGHPLRHPLLQQQRQPQHPGRRRLSALLRRRHRLGRAPVPLRQPRRLAARPVARPGRLHPLPGSAAPLLHRRPQHQPDLARARRRPAHGAGDLRGHGAHATGGRRRRRRRPRRRDDVPRHQLHRRPGEVGQDRHPGLADRQGHGGLREPRRAVARPASAACPTGRSATTARPCPSSSRPPSPSSTSRPVPRRSSSCSTARTPSCSACPRRKALRPLRRDPAGRSDKRVGQNLSVTLEILRQFSKKTADRPIAVRGVPRYADVVKDGVGRYPGRSGQGRARRASS